MKRIGFILAIILGLAITLASIKNIIIPDQITEKILFSNQVNYLLSIIFAVTSIATRTDNYLFQSNMSYDDVIGLLTSAFFGFLLMIVGLGALKETGIGEELTFIFLILLTIMWLFSGNILLTLIPLILLGIIFLGRSQDNR